MRLDEKKGVIGVNSSESIKHLRLFVSLVVVEYMWVREAMWFRPQKPYQLVRYFKFIFLRQRAVSTTIGF